MLKIIFVLTTIFAGLQAPLALSSVNAKSIMKKVENRDVGRDFAAELKMVMASKKGSTKLRKFRWWHLETKSGSKDLLKFTEPTRMRNTGLLIHANDNADNNQWLFLSQAAKKAPRRISGGDRGSKFLGSDFYFIDFETVNAEEFDHVLLKGRAPTVKIKGSKLIGISSQPKDKNHVYDKLHFWVDLKTLVPLKVKFYQDGRHTKTLVVDKLKKIDGIWTTTKTTMFNHRSGSQTQLTLLKTKYNNGLVDPLFTTDKLTQDL